MEGMDLGRPTLSEQQLTEIKAQNLLVLSFSFWLALFIVVAFLPLAQQGIPTAVKSNNTFKDKERKCRKQRDKDHHSNMHNH